MVTMVGLKGEVQDSEWIIDSGSSRHMTFQWNILREYREFDNPEPVHIGDGYTVNAFRTGKIKMILQLICGRKTTGWMTDLLFVQKLASNLFTVHAAALRGSLVSFGHRNCWIWNKKKKLVGIGSPLGKLVKLNCEILKLSTEKANELTTKSKIDLWCQRSGHANVRQIHLLTDSSTGIDLPLLMKNRAFAKPV